MTSPNDFSHSGQVIPDLTPSEDKLTFAAPWQAQVWVMAHGLIDSGQIRADEWAEALGAQIARARAEGEPDTGEKYYEHCLRALESLVGCKSLTSTAELEEYYDAWSRAAARTPHGKPIELRTEDFPVK